MAKKKTKLPKDRLLPKLTVFFFDRPRITAVLWVFLTVFGILSYTTFLNREGFPNVNIPFSFVSGTYFVNDPAKVDKDVAKPIADEALKDKSVKLVQSQSADNFFQIQIQFTEDTDAKVAAKSLQERLNKSGTLPKAAVVNYDVPYFGATGVPETKQIDVALSFYNPNEAKTLPELTAKAEAAAKWLREQKLSLVKDVFVKSPYNNVTDPATGKAVTIQQNFDRFGNRENNQTKYYDSVIIGISKASGADVIKLDDQIDEALAKLKTQPEFKNFNVTVSASFAHQIKDNISELQRVLLEGLLAVLVVGSLVIAIRASIITVISMITVLVITLGLLLVIGYSLNVITLFALILGLALIVDDTIIMVEAIDSARRHEKDRRTAVRDATRKVSRAMVAATITACLCFAPLLFVGGILGNFIRAIPITIISSLIISLFVALIFIPFFARFILLGKKQMGSKGVKEVAAGFEHKLAEFIAKPMMWARNSKKKLFGVGITALVIGFGFLAAGMYIAKDVVFNIFPPTKDTNGLILTVNYPPSTTINQAEVISKNIDKQAAEVVGPNFEISSYYNSGTAQTSTEQMQIISYNKRDITSVDLVKQLDAKFKGFKEAQVIAGQLDVGPPNASFIVQLDANNRPAAFKAANDLADFMKTAELKRINGKVAHFTNVTVSSPDQYIRDGTKPIVTVSSGFDGTDTTTLVTLGQDAVKEEFNSEKLKSYGLNSDALSFNIGQESENQDSFKTLALAFPILLIVMFILLAFQFRSLLQPLLIFMAIPFSIFGVMLGLRITNNAISFFTMLGFFALIGLSIKNTILLTDFANQARRSGMDPIDAAHAALAERFRPLFATSMTAVVSLIPLALSSPFWQGLAVVLIFGLLSNTILVVTVFPYYYLGAEYLRLHISTKDFFIWFASTIAVVIVVSKLTNPGLGFLMIPLSLLLVILQNFFRKRMVAKH